MHELLREAGGCALSLLAAGQEWLAQHFARGVPPIAMWHGIATEGAAGAPLLVGALGWLECGVRESSRRAHTRSSSARFAGSSSGWRPRRSFASAASTRRMIEAVVFDLDGVLVDTEQLWDEVREALARECGGRWHDRAQARLMGMSSTEWSRYLHEDVGLADPPEEINAEVVRRMLARYAEHLPLIHGAVEAVAAARRALVRLALASSSNRQLIDAVLSSCGLGRALRGDGLVGGGRARQARTGRLPRGCATARRRARAVRRDRGLRATASARRTRPGCASSRSRTGATRRPTRRCARRRRARLARGADARRSVAGRRLRDAADEDAAVVPAETHRVRERHVDLHASRASFGT